jgi:hypothetical protein
VADLFNPDFFSRTVIPLHDKLQSRLCERLKRISEATAKAFPKELALYRRWIFKVARYSFHTGRLVVSKQEQLDSA